MVQEIPYIHFKVNNEPIDEVVDYNYTWATIVEAPKGPINEPVYISSAAQAYAIFGIDMRPYFAQNPQSLIMVRAAATSDVHAPKKGKYSFNVQQDIIVYKAMQEEITLTNRESYEKNGQTKWKNVDYTFKLFYTKDTNGTYIPVIEHRDSDGVLIPESYIDSWHNNGRIITEEEAIADAAKTAATPAQKEADDYDPSQYKQGLVKSNIYSSNQVKEYLTPVRFVIPAIDATTNKPTSLFEIESKYEGVYNVSTSCSKAIVGDGYRIVINDKDTDAVSLLIPNGTDVHKIVNRINDADLDIVAKSTTAGDAITQAMHSYPNLVTTTDIDGYAPLITSAIVKDAFIMTSGIPQYDDKGNKSYNNISYLTTENNQYYKAMQDGMTKIYNFTSYSDANGSTEYTTGAVQVIDETNDTYTKVKVLTNKKYIEFENQEFYISKNAIPNSDVIYPLFTDANGSSANIYVKITTIPEPIDYAINLASAGKQSLVGGSNGEWDESAQRITKKYQAQAHAQALKTLRRIRLAGIFCMYGETAIQYEYLQHGINDLEPEKGMNNNKTCKWRTILLGANTDDRSDISSLIAKARNINNQYVLFLGQGLIDTGMTGDIANLTIQEKQKIGAVSDNHLLPYECTQYIAGLRSKLNYGESIFGGQGRKRIRSIGDLKIAPIIEYETEYTWDPNTYIRLNEAGVLTFTEDYGNITLTDGVTTRQTGQEEDEEAVISILKYAENAVYDVCLPYIGRNIDVDLENNIKMDITKVLESMKNDDMTLIDTDEYPAYNITVALNTRKNQLLGRIYVYLVICPVHAVRQVEVEMTVQ